jgi:glycosyltransferase involved in cell wall biosynthesis
VRFLGTRNTSEVVALLRRCDVFVLPSRAEPFGIAAVEAMASARPVIASDVDGLREVIEDGTSGILVPPDAPDALADALHRVLSDAALRAKLAANAVVRARERFSATRMGSDYEARFRHEIAAGRDRQSEATN